MKIIRRRIEKDGIGEVTLSAEEPEDLWHVYNILAVGDCIKATTMRKVTKEMSTGSTSSARLRMSISIQVEELDFDSQGGVIRINGRNIEESEHIKLGQYHTIELELHRNFTIFKRHWDAVYLDRLAVATDPRHTADVAAVVMEEGLAHVCLITGFMTITRARIDANIPRKRKGATGHDKALEKFFETVLSAVIRHVDFAVVKCCIIASPGFTKDQFFEYMNAEALRRDIRFVIENKSKFILAHASSGHKHALNEVLAEKSVLARLADTKAASEVQALDSFYQMLEDDPNRAFYGYNHVRKAVDAAAVQTLLVTDALFRSSTMHTRKKYVALVESVKENGGEVKIFSSLHVSGERLGQLSGVAALLRFPLPDIDEGEDEDETKSESSLSSDGDTRDLVANFDKSGFGDEEDGEEEEDTQTGHQMQEDRDSLGLS
eukprot:GILJ01005290.1.p1 GENE.GILJ01005290.1~~GILJ01005290.1.p1  ORF type:complete len:434 (-),score=75.79 GILJ01005290.1:47-1348(-)